MKKLCFLSFSVFIVLTGCSNRGNQNGKSEPETVHRSSSSVSTDTICFERYSGLEKQDTASVMMIIAGNEVHGRYSNFPYEKDAHIGSISGKKSRQQIKGMWRYQQEGMNDSIPFEFRLEGNRMWQKKTTFDLTSGRETLSDTASFSVLFEKVNCQNTHSLTRQK
jgi:hypothetical protein